MDCVDLRDCRIFRGGGMLKRSCDSNCWPFRTVQTSKSPICGLCGFARLSHILRGWDVETKLRVQLLLPKKSPKPRAR